MRADIKKVHSTYKRWIELLVDHNLLTINNLNEIDRWTNVQCWLFATVQASWFYTAGLRLRCQLLPLLCMERILTMNYFPSIPQIKVRRVMILGSIQSTKKHLRTASCFLKVTNVSTQCRCKAQQFTWSFGVLFIKAKGSWVHLASRLSRWEQRWQLEEKEK